jgi:hypothetical protein
MCRPLEPEYKDPSVPVPGGVMGDGTAIVDVVRKLLECVVVDVIDHPLLLMLGRDFIYKAELAVDFGEGSFWVQQKPIIKWPLLNHRSTVKSSGAPDIVGCDNISPVIHNTTCIPEVAF